jgi:hypothetical protein
METVALYASIGLALVLTILGAQYFCAESSAAEEEEAPAIDQISQKKTFPTESHGCLQGACPKRGDSGTVPTTSKGKSDPPTTSKAAPPSPKAKSEKALEKLLDSCEWMFGDAAEGTLGFHEFAHFNPMRWSGKITFEKAIDQLDELLKHHKDDEQRERPVDVKWPANSGKVEKCATIPKAIEFLKEKKKEFDDAANRAPTEEAPPAATAAH